jgi:hypothetical protein
MNIGVITFTTDGDYLKLCNKFTDSIIKFNPSPKITAASIARAHRGGNYEDWYLPSKNELNKLYLNRVAVEGFVDTNYWSSTEKDFYHAWYQNFLNGNQFGTPKYYTGYVRAIRSF